MDSFTTDGSRLPVKVSHHLSEVGTIRRLRTGHLTATLVVLLLLPLVPHAQDHWNNVDRIVAIGDLHGDFGQYEKLLELNDLVDERLRWKGGQTHLVQLGDIPDRGPDSLKIIRHLMKLQKEAKKAGGFVHALIGNHEAMNIEGDLRYVHTGEYAALVTRMSRRLQANYLGRVADFRISQDPSLANEREGLIERLESEYPPGYVEHRKLWEPGGEVARWVSANNTVIRINRTLFCHGGINPHGELLPVDSINAQISTVLSSRSAPPDNPANDENGPLWYRGLATNDEATELAALDRMLAFHDVDRIVIAHTPTQGTVVSRFGGKVIMVDVGISAFYGSHVANLVIEGHDIYSRTPTGKERLLSEVR